MTIVLISGTIKDLVAKVCIENCLNYSFNETQTPGLISLEVDTNHPAIMFHVGKQIGIAEMRELVWPTPQEYIGE
jgi:hypothetical protein